MKSWQFWEHFQVRSAGFPAAWLDGFTVEGSFDHKLRAERHHLKSVYENLSLQEAVVWQNPSLAKNFLFPWQDKPVGPDRSKVRRVERKLLSYLQRYCSKNESIGYFGPIGWGDLREDLEQPRDERAPWLSNRTVYWEPWLFQELVEHWSHNPEFRAFCRPVFSPRLRLSDDFLEGETRTRRRDGKLSLGQEEARTIRNLDEGQANTSIDRILLQNWDHKRWVSVKPAVPVHPQPERWARTLLEYPEAEDKQTQLSILEEQRHALEQSRGKPRQLLTASQQCLQSLENWGLSSSRSPGKSYAGRLPYYEDAQRRSLDLPAGYLHRVKEPVSLLLESARWFTFEAASRLGQHLDKMCEELVLGRGEGCCATALWDRGLALFKNPEAIKIKELSGQLSKKWLELLGGQRLLVQNVPQHFEASALSEAVRESFACPGALAPRGRFHSVDLFFTKETGAVLGEIHPGLFPFNDIATNLQHPQRERLSDWYSQKVDWPDIWPAQHLAFSRLAQDGRASPQGYHLLTEPHWGSWRPPEQQLRLGHFSIFRKAKGFSVRHTSGLEVSPLVFHQDELLAHLNIGFKPFDFGNRTRPRLVIDGLTIARRRWTLNLEKLKLPRDRAQRYLALNKWADIEGLPAELFAGFPNELKPVLWQRNSILSSELFLNILEKGGGATLEEMWPERQHAWISNDDGVGTGEFRFVVFDERPFADAAVSCLERSEM